MHRVMGEQQEDANASLSRSMSNADRASRLTLKCDGEGTCGGDRLLSQSVSLAGNHVQIDRCEKDNGQPTSSDVDDSGGRAGRREATAASIYQNGKLKVRDWH
jgi:hypothetical protein